MNLDELHDDLAATIVERDEYRTQLKELKVHMYAMYAAYRVIAPLQIAAAAVVWLSHAPSNVPRQRRRKV